MLDPAAVARVHGLAPGDDLGAQAALVEKFARLRLPKIAAVNENDPVAMIAAE